MRCGRKLEAAVRCTWTKEHTHIQAEEPAHTGVRERMWYMRNTEQGWGPGTKAGVCRGKEKRVAEC